MLGEAGLSVLVVEPQSEIYNIPRAVYFDGEVMRVFQAMGLERETSELSAQGKNLSLPMGVGENTSNKT